MSRGTAITPEQAFERVAVLVHGASAVICEATPFFERLCLAMTETAGVAAAGPCETAGTRNLGFARRLGL